MVRERSRGRRSGGSLAASGRKLSWESKAAMEAMLDADAARADFEAEASLDAMTAAAGNDDDA